MISISSTGAAIPIVCDADGPAHGIEPYVMPGHDRQHAPTPAVDEAMNRSRWSRTGTISEESRHNSPRDLIGLPIRHEHERGSALSPSRPPG